MFMLKWVCNIGICVGLGNNSSSFAVGLVLALLIGYFGPGILGMLGLALAILFRRLKSANSIILRTVWWIILTATIGLFLWQASIFIRFYAQERSSHQKSEAILNHLNFAVYMANAFPDGRKITGFSISQDNTGLTEVDLKPDDGAYMSVTERALGNVFNPPNNCGGLATDSQFIYQCSLLTTTPNGRKIYREVNANGDDMSNGIIFIPINNTLLVIVPGITNTQTQDLVQFVDQLEPLEPTQAKKQLQ